MEMFLHFALTNVANWGTETFSTRTSEFILE